jgi:hypothetical protein
MKSYYADVKIDWGVDLDANNKDDFIVRLKELYKEEYNIDLKDDEIHNVQGGK